MGILILTSTGISITETAPSKSIVPQSKIDFNLSDPKKNVCPYAAHIRKTGPRDNTIEGHHIMRRGIQFGGELRSGETTNSDFLDNGKVFLDYTKEKNFRGLLFACYQSNIDNGFRFMQRSEFKWLSSSARLTYARLVQ